VAKLASAFLAGCALATAFAAPLSRIPSLSPLALLVLPFLRPAAASRTRVALGIALLAGVLLTHARRHAAELDCRLHLSDSASGVVTGWFETIPGTGARPFYLMGGLGCEGEVRVLWNSPATNGRQVDREAFVPAAGQPVVARARWQRSARPEATRPPFAGTLVLNDLRIGQTPLGYRTARTRARIRGRVETWLRELFPDTWPVASALILARKEGLDPEVRESFALAGISHLLAISGFHVGVVALLVGVGVRGMGVRPKSAPAVATLITWLYVAFIGFPDAATRAALILTLVSLSRLRARPAGALGAIATALMVLLLQDPFALARPGFQLSFAGALGLVVGAPSIRKALGVAWLRPVPRSARDAVAAGVAATLFTLPFVAWHFGRVSIAGIGTTLLATPLVAAAIPGLLASLAAYGVAPALGKFLAGGTDVLLRALEGLATMVGQLPGASVWVGDATFIGGVIGCVVGAVWVRTGSARLRPWVRRLVIALVGVTGAGAAPLVEASLGMGTVEVVFLNVGQGDAVAIRSPAGRWVLVDTGPRGRSWDAGARIVLPYLRRRGVTGLEALILTHPDLDHIGGARAIAEAFHPRLIIDPAQATGKDAYVDVLEVAQARRIPWIEARKGFVLELDGARLEVLHPDGPTETPTGKSDSNAQSVVLLLTYGAFEALLTGDAPTEVEETLLAELPSDLELLKVGHHGSNTSTSPDLLAKSSPELAVISVGARNRYGHPHSEVMKRLQDTGVRVLRTDLAGHIRVRARRGGLFEVRTRW
jgi:competence protein ComEC